MLQDVLQLIPDKPERAPLPDEVLHYLQRHQIPADIVDDLAQSSYDEWIGVGPVDVIPMPRLIYETTGIAICMEHGFLPVAGCRNFDPVVVCRRSRRVGYVSHELLWSDGCKGIRECLQQSPFAYDEFWFAAVSDSSFPIDYEDAVRRWSKRQTQN